MIIITKSKENFSGDTHLKMLDWKIRGNAEMTDIYLFIIVEREINLAISKVVPISFIWSLKMTHKFQFFPSAVAAAFKQSIPRPQKYFLIYYLSNLCWSQLLPAGQMKEIHQGFCTDSIYRMTIRQV